MPNILPITNYRTPDPERGAVLPHVHDGTMWRALGLLPSPKDLADLPLFGDVHRVIPRKEWASVSYRKFSVPITNQGSHGSCVWHATYTAHRKSWLMSGATDHEFSPTFGYALGNGGRDAGMNIGTALDILKQYGNCLASEFPEGRIWKNDIPAGAYQTAKRFRVLDAYRISPTNPFDELVSALLLGFFPVYDVYVAGDYGNLDRNGISPAHPGYSGNHAQTSDGVTILPDGTPTLENLNSWGRQWGNDGCNRLVEAHFRGKETDAYVITGFVEDPEEKNIPWRAA